MSIARPASRSMSLLLLWLVAFLGCSSRADKGPTFPELKRTALQTADREQWRAKLKWSSDCEDGYRAGAETTPGLSFYPLTDGRSLLEVSCGTGAYQGSQVYFLLDDKRDASRPHGPIVFPNYEASGPDGTKLLAREDTEVTGTADFAAASQQLTVMNNYRGPGDCGSYAKYTFPDNRKAKLVLFRAKVVCDGQGFEHPEQWPVIPSSGT